jgi:nucleotide-binding universal stress UspA family protein
MRDWDYEYPPPSVVVGIDGSRWAIDAALWAVDEAVARDIPLRLVYAIDSVSADPAHAARELATGELAIRYAYTAVESRGKLVKIEVEIVQRRATDALLEASRSAAMICVGSTGHHHATRDRIGSTASALAAAARCPIAVVHRRAEATQLHPGSILAVVDASSTSDVVLKHGLEEAKLRKAQLRVLIERPTETGRDHGAEMISDGKHWARKQLERRLAPWRLQYRDLDIAAEEHRGSMLDYLQSNAGSVQLVVVGPRGPGTLDALFGPAARSTFHRSGCTVLVCSPYSRL